MRLARYKLLSMACLAAALAAGGSATARDLRHEAQNAWFPAGSLVLGTRTLPLDYGASGSNDLDTEVLGVELLDRLGEHLTGGITLARLFLSQSGRAATRGMSPGGATLGFQLYWHRPLLDERLGLLAEGGYFYNDAGGATDSQDTDIDWHSLIGRFGLGVQAGIVSLRGGFVYRDVDGRERTFGDVDQTTSFSLDQREGTFLDLEIHTEPDGAIGLRLEDGAVEQALLYFQTNF